MFFIRTVTRVGRSTEYLKIDSRFNKTVMPSRFQNSTDIKVKEVETQLFLYRSHRKDQNIAKCSIKCGVV